MQSVAQMWLVLRLTQSGVALGITAALQFTPMLVLGAWGGLLADRSDKRRLLMATQTAAGCIALALAAITLSGQVRLWMVYLLAFCLGLVNMVDNPTRQSFVTEMVGPGQINNAVSLNSAVFTSARVIGPAAAGLLIGLVGTGWCFLYNGFSYFPVVGALALMKVDDLHRVRPVIKARGQIKEGVRYAWARPELRLPLLLMVLVGAFAFNFSVVLPLMARYAFHSGAGTFGALLSLMGVGSLAGALLAAGREHPTHRLLVASCLAFGCLLVIAAAMPDLPLEMAALVPVGAAMTTYQATTNTLLQLNSEVGFRGRVMALYVIVFLGSTPVGGPLVGWVGQQFGPRTALGLGGVAAVVAGLGGVWALARWGVGRASPAGPGLPRGAPAGTRGAAGP